MRRTAFRLAVALALTLGPAAAFAHPGNHLHPHGAGSALTAMGVATILAAGTWFLMRDR